MRCCLRCRLEIPSTKRAHAVYCSESCRSLAEHVRKRHRDIQKGIRTKSRSVYDMVKSLLGGVCTECGSTERLEVDHIIPWSVSPDNSRKNLQLLCKEHHQIKTKKEKLNS